VTGAAGYQSAQPDATYFDGIYWAVTTMTTVGYGDELPITVEAKVLAMALMLVGIGYFAVITGAIAERFIDTEPGSNESLELDETADVAERLGRLVKHTNELAAELQALKIELDATPTPPAKRSGA
jgi:voltage-gated potassium channel